MSAIVRLPLLFGAQTALSLSPARHACALFCQTLRAAFGLLTTENDWARFALALADWGSKGTTFCAAANASFAPVAGGYPKGR